MEGSSNPNIGEASVGELDSTRCDQRYKIISDYKNAFGDAFDNMKFLNYTTGEIDVPGSALREAQTGCEIYEQLGWTALSITVRGFTNADVSNLMNS